MAVAAVATGAQAMSFEDHVKLYGLKFTSPEEETARRAVFAFNDQRITEHNAKGESWTMGHNAFSALTSEEFGSTYIGGWRGKQRVNPMDTDLLLVDPATLPTSVDWTTKGVVTPVKNQGQCGSCWSFSTTGSVEGIHAIKTGNLVSLSEQQLVDCSGTYGNMGCNGGLMDNAFRYIIAEGGLCSEAAYPYTASQGTCQASSCQKVATITGYQDVPIKNGNAFMTAIAQQPVSIAIEADQLSFQFYSGGVMTGQCGTNLDHGVLAVGYGSLNGQSFWKVKNSWGASWGMQGYILLDGDASMNGGAGQCGILSVPSYPEA
jgi:cathepsin L